MDLSGSQQGLSCWSYRIPVYRWSCRTAHHYKQPGAIIYFQCELIVIKHMKAPLQGVTKAKPLSLPFSFSNRKWHTLQLWMSAKLPSIQSGYCNTKAAGCGEACVQYLFLLLSYERGGIRSRVSKLFHSSVKEERTDIYTENICTHSLQLCKPGPRLHKDLPSQRLTQSFSFYWTFDSSTSHTASVWETAVQSLSMVLKTHIDRNMKHWAEMKGTTPQHHFISI